MEISLTTLAMRSFRASKIRNLAAVLAIVLTTVLFTTVTATALGTMKSLTLTQQVAKGSKADGDFQNMTAELMFCNPSHGTAPHGENQSGEVEMARGGKHFSNTLYLKVYKCKKLLYK